MHKNNFSITATFASTHYFQSCLTSQLGRFSAPLTGQNSKSLVRDICTKFSITNLLLGNCVLGQYLGNVQNSLTKPILSQACKDFLIITKPHKFQFNFTKKKI